MRSEAKRGAAGRTIAALGLTALVLAACLILPENLLQAWDQERLGAVREADTEYYSREMAAYTGELNLYRKLLLMQGVWKSEKRFVTEGTYLKYEFVDDSNIPMDSLNQTQAGAVLNETIMQIQDVLIQSGVEIRDTDGAVKIYEYQDTELGKYRFSVADLNVTMWMSTAVEVPYPGGVSNEAEASNAADRKGNIRCLIDLENGDILAMQLSLEMEESGWMADWIPAIKRMVFQDDIDWTGVDVLEEDWFPEPMGWERSADFTIYSQNYKLRRESTSTEWIYLVIQNDTEGLTFFYSLDKKETAA